MCPMGRGPFPNQLRRPGQIPASVHQRVTRTRRGPLPVSSRVHVWLALSTLLVSAAASAETGAGQSAPSILFSPLSAEFTARPGERLAQDFSITNRGDQALELQVSTADAWHDRGKRIFPAPGTVSRGAGAWLVAPPPTLVVEPGETRTFLGSARVPDDAEPGSYFGAYLVRVVNGDASGLVPRRAITAGARMNLQFALAMVIRVPESDGALANAVLSVVEAEVVEAGHARPLVVRAVVHNDSIADTRADGNLVLFDADGRPRGRSTFARSLLMPGERRAFSTSLALPLDPGDYRALLAFAGGDTEATVFDLRFTVESDGEGDQAPKILSPERPGRRERTRSPVPATPIPGPGEPGSRPSAPLPPANR